MPRRKKDKSPEENIPQGPSGSQDPLRKRMRKHRADPKDKITDEDIRNVKVERAAPLELETDVPRGTNEADEIIDVEAASPLPIPENATRVVSEDPDDEKKEDDKGEKKHITPWDILSE